MKLTFVLETILLSFLGIHLQEIYSDSCSGRPYDDTLFCEKETELMVGFDCINKTCQKTIINCLNGVTKCLTSLDVCRLTCGQPPLWPLPNGEMEVSKCLTFIQSGNEVVKVDYVLPSGDTGKLNDLLNTLRDEATEYIKVINKGSRTNSSNLYITFEVKNADISFQEAIDESYTLIVNETDGSIRVQIAGSSYFGVRHGLETLLQLIVFDRTSNSLVTPSSVRIVDKPAYKHRGLLLDSARNYYTVESIKRTLDAMAMNKLNVLHWHITDSQSFPYVSKQHPKMAEVGAYSSTQVYTQQNISDIVEYARLRGVKVIPELDTPAHVGEGWQTFNDSQTGQSYLVCFNKEPWNDYCAEPPCGQLNPTVEGVYDVLRDLYKEYNELFDSDLFHMGGDEVSLKCWDTPEINNWIRTKSGFGTDSQRNEHALWFHFQTKALHTLEQVNSGKQRIVLWTSTLTDVDNIEKYLSPNKYIIQIWDVTDGSKISRLVSKGYDLIFSNVKSLYLDCGFGSWLNEEDSWCSPYKQWRTLYTHNPSDILKNAGVNLTESNYKQVLGSEAALWSEQSDTNTADTRFWPRASALAERLWTNPETNWKPAVTRLMHHRERMVSRGIGADPLQPLWCSQHEGYCV